MDALDESYTRSKNEYGNFKIPETAALLRKKVESDFDVGVENLDDNKSLCNVKNIYSAERVGFMSPAKTEQLTRKSHEKLYGANKLFRTSSTTLGKDIPNEFRDYSKMTFTAEHTLAKSGNDLFLLDILGMKKFALSNYIQDNAKAADLKWSLFCAACHSYRYDSILRPFPPMFFEGDVKDIDKLRDVAESCPSISVVYKEVQERSSNTLSSELISLLYWALIHMREPHLKFVPKEMHSNILSKVMSTTAAATPHYIFQVMYNKTASQEKFNEMAKNYKIIHAFHGSRLDNFFSILNYGLRISFNKISAYGPGIYLSSEMNVSLPYSQTGFSWGGSIFGSRISVVALCEMIDHPDVKYSTDIGKKRDNKFISDVNTVPEKYFIVQNGDLIRVKYLLVYCNTVPDANTNQISTITTWFQKNKVMAVILAYVILLLAIATSNSSTVHKYYKRVIRKLGLQVLKV